MKKTINNTMSFTAPPSPLRLTLP